MKKSWLYSLVALVAAVATSSVASAQLTSPADVVSPRPDYSDPSGRPDIPTLRSEIQNILPQIQFIFDTALDPQQLSILETLTQGNIDDTRLSEGARSVIRNHMAALQQVELAIRFLQANRSQIIAGNSPTFNSIFGNISQLRDVAIISPSPISGTATLVRPAVGNNNNNNTVASQYYQLTFQAQGGGNNNNNQQQASVTTQLRAGDYIYVAATNGTGQAAGNTVAPLAFLARVYLVTGGSTQGGGNNNNNNSQQRIILDPALTPVIPTNAQLNNLQVSRVLRFDRQADPTRYDSVLNTFQAIRDALEGVMPRTSLLGAQALQLSASPITYNRNFTNISTVWAPGIAPFSQLDPTVSNFVSERIQGINITAAPPVADRRVRQFGFSTSDSFAHLDRLEDQAAGRTQDVRGRPTFPLLWADDNDLPLTFDTRVRVTNSTDDDRAFFRDRQTIFGEPDNVFTQYLGRAFFDETVLHGSDLTLDDSVRVDSPLQQAQRQQRIPAGGTPQTSTSQNNGAQPTLETADVPESGNPTTKDTEFRRWQMIIESFAEHATDLTQFNTAAVGLSELLGGGALPGDLAVKDAGNYARFSDLVGGSGAGSVDVDKVEPFGKRADGGFNPVVPIQ